MEIIIIAVFVIAFLLGLALFVFKNAAKIFAFVLVLLIGYVGWNMYLKDINITEKQVKTVSKKGESIFDTMMESVSSASTKLLDTTKEKALEATEKAKDTTKRKVNKMTTEATEKAKEKVNKVLE